MFIQRFGSALYLNVYFHMLLLDGVYDVGGDCGQSTFRRVKSPSPAELQTLVQRISQRLARFLVREGLLVQDAENSYLTLDNEDDDSPLPHLQQHSITYRIAVGPQQGRKVFTLQTLPPHTGSAPSDPWANPPALACTPARLPLLTRATNWSVSATIIARPAVSETRLSLTPNSQVRYMLKTPYRDETTHVIFEPLDFMARLAGRPGTKTASQPHPLSRYLCTQQPSPRDHHRSKMG